MDATIVGVILAIAACIAAFLFLGKSEKTPEKTPPPVVVAPAEAKPAAVKPVVSKIGGGKKGKKEEKKHPQCRFQFKGHAGAITCSRVSMTGKMVATTGEDRRLILWNIAEIPPTQTLNLQPELDHGAAIATSPDDKFFAVVFARSKEVKIYPSKGAKDGAHVSFASKHITDVTDLIWSYSGKYLLTFAMKDKDAVRLWSPRGEPMGTINPGALEAYNVVLSPDSRFISIATMQCDAKIWEVGTDKDGFGFKGKAMELAGRTGGSGSAGHASAVHSVDFGGCSPANLVTDSSTAATGSKDGTCKVWNIAVRYRQNEDPKCILTVDQPDKQPISKVAISRGKIAKYLATWSATAGLVFWGLPSGEKLSVVGTEDTGHVFHMEWFESEIEPHHHMLLCASPDGRSQAWLPVPP